jgi:hypothetical protein
MRKRETPPPECFGGGVLERESAVLYYCWKAKVAGSRYMEFNENGFLVHGIIIRLKTAACFGTKF